jgi:hypothetical protein
MESSLVNPSFHEFPPALAKGLLNQENFLNSRGAVKMSIQSWHEPLKSIIIIIK